MFMLAFRKLGHVTFLTNNVNFHIPIAEVESHCLLISLEQNHMARPLHQVAKVRITCPTGSSLCGIQTKQLDINKEKIYIF